MIRRLNHNHRSAGSQTSHSKSSNKTSTNSTKQKNTSEQEKLDQSYQFPHDKVSLSAQAKEMLHYFNIVENTHRHLEKNGTIKIIAERLCSISLFMRIILADDIPDDPPSDDLPPWTHQDFLKSANDLVRTLLFAFIKDNPLTITAKENNFQPLQLFFFLSTASFSFQFCGKALSPDLFSVHFDGRIRDQNSAESSKFSHFSWQMTLPAYPAEKRPLADDIPQLEQKFYNIFSNPDLKILDNQLSFFVSSPFFDSEQTDLKISIHGITLDSFVHERHISLKL